MLSKLIKYDMNNKMKFLSIFYIIALFFAILTRVFFIFDNSTILNILAKICSGVTISMFFNIIINNLMRFWVRYKTNLYGDESYLTHTLPVSKKTLYLSKIISAILSLFISFIVIAITLFIAYYSKENLQIIKNIILPIESMYDISIMWLLIEILFILFLEILNLIQIGFTGITLGHQMNSAKTGYSILYGFLCYIVLQSVVLLTIFICGLFNKPLLDLFVTNAVITLDIAKTILIISTVIYTALFVVNYFINVKLFAKGVNVD